MKVLAITTSYRRLDYVYATILQMRLQSHPVFHSVRMNCETAEEETVARNILDTIYNDQVSIFYRRNENQHTNHLSCVSSSPVQDWDLIVKIDDDDLYLPDYVKNVVAFHQQHPEVQVSTTPAERAVVEGQARIEHHGTLIHDQDTPAGQDEYAMPPTLAFTRQAYEVIHNLPDPVGMWEDKYWQLTWAEAGLVHRQRPGGAADWIWNVHGRNTTTNPTIHTPGSVIANASAAQTEDEQPEKVERTQEPTPQTLTSPAEEDHQMPSQASVPRATASPTSEKKLTIGMATYDDYDGVYFTVQALRLHHPEVTDHTEIIVLDNTPDGPSAQALQDLANWIPGYRYILNREHQGTASRDRVFREANTPYVMCLDSHVLLVPGAVRQLIAYFDAHPDCRDLLQGPLVYDVLHNMSTHFDPVWSAGMYGVWGTDERAKDPTAPPFEIPIQSLGLFACRRDAWLGFNPRFLGFGGEEGYIHEKFRQAGQRTLCLPFLRWLHRFTRPQDTSYPNSWYDRVRNYIIGWRELGLDTTPVEEHFQELLGADHFPQDFDKIQAELNNPFSYFDAIYCINLDSATDRWEAMQRRFACLGIAHRVRRFSAIETPESHHIGCALSHRGIIEQAEKYQFRNVLVFEDDALFLEDTLTHLSMSINELKTQDWHLLHLGGHTWEAEFPNAPGCAFLKHPCEALTTTHAVAYNAPVYHHLLFEIPSDMGEMKEWLAIHAGIDQYFRYLDKRYLTSPRVASQRFLLGGEEEAFQDQFTLGDGPQTTLG